VFLFGSVVGCIAEYNSVNNALDEISAFMDVLEERNDHLFAKVQQLLKDSHHARLQAQVDQESDQEKPSNSQQPASSTDGQWHSTFFIFTWLTNHCSSVLAYYTVGWIIWPVKSSLKWLRRIMCPLVVWDVKPYIDHTYFYYW